MAFAFQIRHSASQDRLEKLIEQRLVPGADKEAIDAHIWDLFGENWVVMFTDLSGFSQEVAEFGIIHFLQIIHESHKLLVPCIDAYGGILLKIEADSMLVIFRNVQKALDCAVHMQRTVQEHNRHKIPIEHILLCIGIGFGTVLRIGDEDVFGEEVNAASKLGEEVAHSWDILVTRAVWEAIAHVTPRTFSPVGSLPPGMTGAYRLHYQLADEEEMT